MVDYEALIPKARMFIDKGMTATGLPGLAIALVDNGSVVWAEGFGVTGDEAGTPVTADTLFSVQSISKTYTGFGFMTAVGKGMISLDDPVVSRLPWFSVKNRFTTSSSLGLSTGDSKGAGDISAITFRHLLSHRSGLPHEAEIGNNFGKWECSFEEHVKSIPQSWLKYPVGTAYSYSNLGIDLAGYALGEVSGLGFEKYMEEHVMNPIGMKMSTFRQAEALSNPLVTRGHTDKGRVDRMQIPMLAAGGLWSSVADMSRFVSCCMAGGSLDGCQVIASKLLAEMTKPQFTDDMWGYGLGVSRYHWAGEAMLNHNGGGYGFRATQEWLEESKLGCIVLTNSSAHPNIHCQVSQTLLKVIKVLKKAEPPRVSTEMERYEGTYEAPVYNDVSQRQITFLDGLLLLDTSILTSGPEGVLFTEDGESVEFVDGSDANGRPSVVISGVRHSRLG